MCEISKMPETYMVLTKEKKGHKAFCYLTLREASKAQNNLHAVEIAVGGFSVVTDIFFAKGPELRRTILGLNAKENLLGINYYKNWNPQQKISAHFRIWKYKIARSFGAKEYRPSALSLSCS